MKMFKRWYIGGVLLLSSICILYMYVLHDNGECKPLDEENKEDVETVVMKTLSILQRFSSSRSCSCRRGSSNLTSSFEAANLTSIRKRRAEEYRKKQIRQRTDLDVVLISPSNSPLQYPSHGFTVEPLRWTFIPDINSQVTITTKTFLRYKELRVLIKSIRERYPNIRIIIADDSLKIEKVGGHNTDQYIMPPSQGWFAGRNLAISQVTTKYFLWVDDDFRFLNETRIEKFVEIMEAVPELDVLGGSVDKDRFYFNLEHEDGDDGEGGCLSRFMQKAHSRLPGFNECVVVDGVINFFLARTDAVRRVGFDPKLKRVAHTEFFMDGLGQLLVASCPGLVIGHQPKQSTSEYRKFRHPGRGDVDFKLRLHYFKNHLKCVAY